MDSATDTRDQPRTTTPEAPAPPASRQKPKPRRTLIIDLRATALQNRWEDALAISEEMLERFPPDAETFNAKGRALSALRRYPEAFEAYQESLRLDPPNMIARRNLQRLDILRNRDVANRLSDVPVVVAAIPRTNVFIEEVGKTWRGELVNATDTGTLNEVSTGEQLEMVIDGERLYVEDQHGTRLGEFDADTARRVIELTGGGNRYEVYALGITTQSIAVILREVYRDPRLATRVSFPGKIKATRAYLRERDLLMQRDEADFLDAGDDDDLDDDEDSGRVRDPGDDIEGPDNEAASYVPSGTRIEEDDENAV